MEIFDILSKSGRTIGTASRKICHDRTFLLHAVIHILVFNGEGKLLLQKRSPNKDIQPGKWDTSVGGHILAGEKTNDALGREAEEELGINDTTYEYLYSYIMTSDVEREFVTTYRCNWKGPVILSTEEITEVRAFAEEEIESNLCTGFFTPNFEDEWRYYREWLDRQTKR